MNLPVLFFFGLLLQLVPQAGLGSGDCLRRLLALKQSVGEGSTNTPVPLKQKIATLNAQSVPFRVTTSDGGVTALKTESGAAYYFKTADGTSLGESRDGYAEFYRMDGARVRHSVPAAVAGDTRPRVADIEMGNSQIVAVSFGDGAYHYLRPNSFVELAVCGIKYCDFYYPDGSHMKRVWVKRLQVGGRSRRLGDRSDRVRAVTPGDGFLYLTDYGPFMERYTLYQNIDIVQTGALSVINTEGGFRYLLQPDGAIRIHDGGRRKAHLVGSVVLESREYYAIRRSDGSLMGRYRRHPQPAGADEPVSVGSEFKYAFDFHILQAQEKHNEFFRTLFAGEDLTDSQQEVVLRAFTAVPKEREQILKGSDLTGQQRLAFLSFWALSGDIGGTDPRRLTSITLDSLDAIRATRTNEVSAQEQRLIMDELDVWFAPREIEFLRRGGLI